jgi:hypothetical protein
MDIEREDLVGFALGALPVEETGRIAGAVARDPALARELKEIERHLRLHGETPRLEPAPPLWESIRARLDEPIPVRRPFLRRYWMPAAAAALMALAVFLPRPSPTRLERLHGDVVASADGSLSANTVARVRVGGLTLTLDAGTNLELSSERLALRAGRVFLEVTPERRGFTVVAGDLVAVTTGTAFLVERGERTFVSTESGQVRCFWRGREQLVGPGQAFFASDDPLPPPPPSPRGWFQRPSILAEVLTPETIRVTLANAMPDPITIAPPTGGEPLFFASYGGHDVPLAPDDFATVTLAPGASRIFHLRLPRPLPDREAPVVSYPAGGVRAEATR